VHVCVVTHSSIVQGLPLCLNEPLYVINDNVIIYTSIIKCAKMYNTFKIIIPACVAHHQPQLHTKQQYLKDIFITDHNIIQPVPNIAMV
jgi:hypothetical protein